MTKELYLVTLDVATLKQSERFTIEYRYRIEGELISIDVNFFDLKCDSFTFHSEELAIKGLNGLLTFLKTQD